MTAAIFPTGRIGLALALSASVMLGTATAQTSGDAATGTTAPAGAEPATAPASAEPAAAPAVTLELNRLEPVDGICRSYFVVGNNLSEPLREMQLDTFFFDDDDIVSQRLALVFENVRAERRKVVLFDLDLACEEIGSVLVNDMLSCTAASGPVEDCAETLAVSSRTEQELRY